MGNEQEFELVLGREYCLNVSGHAQAMLAARVGIVVDDVVTAYFNSYRRDESNHRRNKRHSAQLEQNDGRGVRGVWTVEVKNGSRRAVLILKGKKVVTALSCNEAEDKSENLQALAHYADIIRAISPEILSLEEIVSWRETIIESNGRVTKDDFRKHISKTMNVNLPDPYEELGIPRGFLSEVRELRERFVDLLDEKESREIEFGAIDSDKYERFLAENRRLVSLARCKSTLIFGESDEERLFLNKEYTAWRDGSMRASWEEDQEMAREAWRLDQAEREKVKSPQYLVSVAELGVPDIGVKVAEKASGQPVIFYDSCEVIAINSSAEDGWHRLYFKHTESCYCMVTRFKKIIDSYVVGSIGVWAVDYGDKLCLEPRTDA